MTEKQPEDISQTASNLFLSTFMGAQRTEAPVVSSTLSRMVVVTMSSNDVPEETRGNWRSSLCVVWCGVQIFCVMGPHLLDQTMTVSCLQAQSESRARDHQTGAWEALLIGSDQTLSRIRTKSPWRRRRRRRSSHQRLQVLHQDPCQVKR